VRLAAAAALAVVTLAGCGGPAKQDAVNVATTWLKAVEQGDETAACKLMDEGTARLIAHKLALDAPPDDCGAVMAAYRDRVGSGVLGDVVDAGLEPEGRVKAGRLGVFPKDQAHRFDVVLMHFDGRRWTVASTSLG
jgi:hypothetical protein